MNNSENDNINSDNDMDVENGFSTSLLIFAGVATFMIMVVGIVGNFLTVVALVKCPKVRNVAAAFIISLCLADLLFCALVLPFSALRFIHGTWTHGHILCKLIPFIQYGNIGVSLLCIAMITINRYVMIAHHSSYGKIYKKHWIAVMIAFCWLFSYGMQLPTLFGVWGIFGFDPKLQTCSIMSDSHGRSSKTALFIIAFVIPCLIIIACYAKIFWVVHKSEVRLQKHANKQNSIPNNLRPLATPSAEMAQSRVSSNAASDSSFSTDAKHEAVQKPSRIKDQREMRAKRNEWRITKMVLAIFLSFVICYLPITIAKVADKDVEHPGFHIFSYIMLYLSACLNPIIYVIMNKQYRKAYKTVVMCETAKLLPFGKAGGGGGGGGGSSAAEKWKDTGLSNNHSRTMVSQMSAVEPQNSSLGSSQPPPIALELTANPHVKKPFQHQSLVVANISPTQARPTPTAKVIAQQPKTNGTLQNNNNNNNSSSSSSTTASMAPALSPATEIIPEEEEDTATAYPAVEPLTQQLAVHGPTTYANVGLQRKTPFYGQNINAIPDNSNTKLQAKSKI